MRKLSEQPFFSNIKQMALLVIQEEMSERHLVGMDLNPVPKCKECCCVVLGFVSCILSVWCVIYICGGELSGTSECIWFSGNKAYCSTLVLK